MYTKNVIILNASGLHARPAKDFIDEAKKYKARIFIRRNEPDAKNVNAKSIVMLLSLALVKGSEAVITAEGEDEQMAVDALAALIESGFDES